LVVDDTQALGVLGQFPSAAMPYGCGGGGSLRWSGIVRADALIFSSLAKGFGVPLAVLAGSRAWIQKFKDKSLTRVHCSPPSIAVLRAAERALACNHREGNTRRGMLLDLVRRFRCGLSAAGVSTGPGLFPVQTIRSPKGMAASVLHRRLAERGIRAVLHRSETGNARVSFLTTAAHAPEQIDTAISAIGAAMTLSSSTSKPTPKETYREKSIQH
jgi:8-amino-7-oxononanoate synthase